MFRRVLLKFAIIRDVPDTNCVVGDWPAQTHLAGTCSVCRQLVGSRSPRLSNWVREAFKLIIRSYPIAKSTQTSQGQFLAVSRRGVRCRTASYLPVETRALSAGHSEPLPLLNLKSSVGPSGVDSDDFRFCLALTLQATFRPADQLFCSLPFHCGTLLTSYTPLTLRPLQPA
jgi:hypothetical protein